MGMKPLSKNSLIAGFTLQQGQIKSTSSRIATSEAKGMAV